MATIAGFLVLSKRRRCLLNSREALRRALRALAILAVFDGRFRIGLPRSNAEAFELDRRRAPRQVDLARRQLRKFGNPAPHMGTFGIELLALEEGIEDAK